MCGVCSAWLGASCSSARCTRWKGEATCHGVVTMACLVRVLLTFLSSMLLQCATSMSCCTALAAVQSNGTALEFATNEFKANKEIVAAAAKQHAFALMYDGILF